MAAARSAFTGAIRGASFALQSNTPSTLQQGSMALTAGRASFLRAHTQDSDTVRPRPMSPATNLASDAPLLLHEHALQLPSKSALSFPSTEFMLQPFLPCRHTDTDERRQGT